MSDFEEVNNDGRPRVITATELSVANSRDVIALSLLSRATYSETFREILETGTSDFRTTNSTIPLTRDDVARGLAGELSLGEIALVMQEGDVVGIGGFRHYDGIIYWRSRNTGNLYPVYSGTDLSNDAFDDLWHMDFRGIVLNGNAGHIGVDTAVHNSVFGELNVNPSNSLRIRGHSTNLVVTG